MPWPDEVQVLANVFQQFSGFRGITGSREIITQEFGGMAVGFLCSNNECVVCFALIALHPAQNRLAAMSGIPCHGKKICAACATKWLKHRSTCPLCREEVLPVELDRCRRGVATQPWHPTTPLPA